MEPLSCWCGNTQLEPFGLGYCLCGACQTLVSASAAAQSDPRVRDDATAYYGRDYWFRHQTADLNCPNIITRSRTDLSERCVHWLRSLLHFKLPPAKVLEIGCAHGGFVAMLRQAGFDASGLELSPSIVELARKSFDVPVLTGPIEDQPISPATYDAIVMIDVMEHLPNPLQTLKRCLELLKPDGVLFIQTPSYPEGYSAARLRTEDHKFQLMIDPQEHLYLFSRSATMKAFEQLNAPYVEFVPAIFRHYDMSFAVSRRPLLHHSLGQRDTALSSTVSGRFMQALIDADDRRLDLLDKYRELRLRAAS